MSQPQKRLRVGVLGAGEVAQVIHLPVLSLLTHLYTVEAICDISGKVGTSNNPRTKTRNELNPDFLPA
jgi:hypothetical protein